MKAAVLYEVRQPLKIEELKMPDVDDEDVLIKVASCGVCHTDLKVVEGRTRFTPPTILGHEVAGTVEQVGAYCKDFKSGDRVIIGMRYKCGRCRYCLSARENLCERRPAPPPLKTIDGTIVTRWNVGGFAEYVSVPAYMAFKIPDGMSMEEASVVGCRVTTAYNAVKHRARLEPGDSALVIGCGGIGLNTIQFLKCFGAYPIIAVDIADEKLAAAKSFGATHTINATRGRSGESRDQTHRRRCRQGLRGDRQPKDFRPNHPSDPSGWHGNDHRRFRQRAFHDQQRPVRDQRNHHHGGIEPPGQ